MRVLSEMVQIRTLAREIGVRPRRRSRFYVEEPDVDFSCQSAEMCHRSRTLMHNPGYTCEWLSRAMISSCSSRPMLLK
jgi:hypothetical protein